MLRTMSAVDVDGVVTAMLTPVLLARLTPATVRSQLARLPGRGSEVRWGGERRVHGHTFFYLHLGDSLSHHRRGGVVGDLAFSAGGDQ